MNMNNDIDIFRTQERESRNYLLSFCVECGDSTAEEVLPCKNDECFSRIHKPCATRIAKEVIKHIYI